MMQAPLNKHDHADECGCKLSMAFLIAAVAWVVGRRIWGEADLWALTNLGLLIGAATLGKLIGVFLFRRTYQVAGQERI